MRVRVGMVVLAAAACVAAVAGSDGRPSEAVDEVVLAQRAIRVDAAGHGRAALDESRRQGWRVIDSAPRPGGTAYLLAWPADPPAP